MMHLQQAWVYDGDLVWSSPPPGKHLGLFWREKKSKKTSPFFFGRNITRVKIAP
jgi:hypothetical protein